jgi:predicted DNA-binding ribbon-helix-helix protein|tara:strand:+ start:208 stop:447 length:240 start_codon:yes stop_codon:yes gene_type:complete
VLRKRSVTIAGHRTSISLEDEFWSELVRIVSENQTSLNSMISAIDEARTTNLSSAIRLHVLANLKGTAQELTQTPETVG